MIPASGDPRPLRIRCPGINESADAERRGERP